MGMSADAIIFYGYAWTDEDDLNPEFREEGWEDVLAEKLGYHNPWKRMPAHLNDTGPGSDYQRNYKRHKELSDLWVAEHRTEIDKWYEDKRALAESINVDMAWHCHADYPMTYVYAKPSKVRAWQGDPVEVPTLEIDPNWDTQLDQFCDELDITRPQDTPRWWLVSYYS